MTIAPPGARPHLADLFDPIDLEQAIAGKFVSVKQHPDLPLRIFNYTDETTFSRAWTPVTRQCRGLIVDPDGYVVARPLPKFFNHGEPGAPEISLGAAVSVTDKLDGSLGILYPTGDGGHAIATRGSFTSEQAQHATALYQERYADRFTPAPGWTYLFEIIYPGNRIVVDYGDLDDLVLLAIVDNVSGGTLPAELVHDWPGPRAEIFQYATLADALAAPPRPGMEGLVVEDITTGQRVKIKQDDYIALHRILTGVTARKLWEFLAVNACWDHAQQRKTEGDPTAYLVRKLRMGPDRIAQIRAAGQDWVIAYLVGVPEEFRAWVEERLQQLRHDADAAHRRLLADVAALRDRIGLAGLIPREQRKDAVLAAQSLGEEWRQVLAAVDGHEMHTWAWSQCYPGPESPFRSVSEDTA